MLNINELMNTIWTLVTDYYFPVLISVPISLLLYLIFHRYNHSIVVNLGEHRWVIK
ncbi:MAG: hypothetical protein H7230_00645 [Candidatus Parcubacteria bacterium]|nr:hypothetical protein [Candidatus Paceibacterota bacterium]